MATETIRIPPVPPAEEWELMHARYLRGGRGRQMAPHIDYPEASCPHPGCGDPLQAIDFRLEDHGRAVHDRLVRAWWDDRIFVGRCPHCGGWIHFTVRARRALTTEDASTYPHLPENWYEVATIL